MRPSSEAESHAARSLRKRPSSEAERRWQTVGWEVKRFGKNTQGARRYI
jgi:hypothetical protein